MQFKGTVFRYGRDIDTDVIIPARYLNTSDPAELARHCLEDLDTTFVERVRPGDIIVADENFGCGSSREHAPVCIKAAGVSCVIAKSFARIHMANLINSGILPLVFCDPADYDAVAQGDELVIENAPAQVESGEEIVVKNVTRGTSFKTKLEVSPRLRKILLAGGLILYTRAQQEK